MRKNKGITLVSLIGYVILAIMALSVLVALTTNFKKNFNELDVQAVQDVELDKINMQISKDIKDGKKVDKTNFSSTKLAFIDGNTYTYVSNDKKLYMNDNVTISEHLRSCTFELPTDDILRVTAQVEDKTRTMEFPLEGTYVARIEKVYYKTLQSAINAVPANNKETTITILTDISENTTIAQNQNIVLDIGIYTLNNKEDNAVITSSGSLKIKNGKITGNPTEQPLINNKPTGVLDIVGGTITSETSIALGNYGTINISGTAKIDGNIAIANTTEGRVIATGGKISSSLDNAIANYGKLEIDGTTIIEGMAYATIGNAIEGEIITKGGRTSSELSANTIYNLGNVEISGTALIEGTAENYPTIYNCEGGNVELKGGKIYATDANVINNFGILKLEGNVVIESLIEGEGATGTQRPACFNDDGATFLMTNGTISSKTTALWFSENTISTINGGTIYSKNSTAIWCDGTLTITGGTITGGDLAIGVDTAIGGSVTVTSSNTIINGGTQGVNFI